MSQSKRAAKSTDGFAMVITPMLDMAFLLLAFFILTYRPASLQEGYFAGTLLPSSEQKPSGPQHQPPLDIDIEPELEEIIRVRVSSVPKGSTYLASQKYEGMPEKVEIEFVGRTEVVGDQNTKVGVTMRNLAEQLNAFVKSAKAGGDAGPKLKLVIDADDALKHQYFINIYDACMAADFDQISFAQPPGLKTGKASN